MSASVIGKRYAKALLHLAEEAGAVERMGRDLRDFASTWQENRQLRHVFENPRVASQTRKQILAQLAQGAQMHEHVKNLLMLLADRMRLRHVDEIADAYEGRAEQKSGLVRAEVISATELPAEYFDQLQGTLEQLTGKKVSIARRIDPELMGGVITRVGDKVIDGSVRSRLDQLRDELLTT